MCKQDKDVKIMWCLKYESIEDKKKINRKDN